MSTTSDRVVDLSCGGRLDTGQLDALRSGLPAHLSPPVPDEPKLSLTESMLREAIERMTRARIDRLDREAQALLDAGVPFEELTLVTSPLHPDGTVITREQCAEHEAELRMRGWPA